MKRKKNKISNQTVWKSASTVLFSGVFFFSFLLISSDGTLSAQQDPQYSQYMFNQFAINPAYAGSKEAISTTMFLRRQWSGFDNGGEPTTETITIHSPLRKKKVALGFAFIADRIGPKNTFGILGSYAYRVRLGKGKLSMGLRLGIYQYYWKSINFKEIETGITNEQLPSFIVPSADAGAYYYTNTMYAGLSFTHLDKGILKINLPNGTGSNLIPHGFLTAGKAWELSEKLIFSPSCMVKVIRKTAVTTDLNISFLLQKRLWLGMSFRSSYGFVGYTQFYISNKFKIGYAYDFGTTKVSRWLGASHEIMLSYDISLSKPPFFSPRYF